MAAKQSSPLLRELARRLKSARESQQLTIQEVYDATGIHVGRIEANGINITILTLVALCQHYHIALATLIGELELLADKAPGNQ